MRAALDDTSPTGATFTIEESTLWHKTREGGSGGPIPEFLANPALRHMEAKERTCDAAAARLVELVVGLPQYHPLFKDADKRLAALRTAFDRLAGKYRRAIWRETDALGLRSWTPAFLPDIRPLGRTATADDVKAGTAIFHLAGTGSPADLKLPAVATLKRDEKTESPPRVLIVQAELGGDGQVTYGVITRDGIRAVTGRDLVAIKTFAQLDEEDKKAAEKEKKK